MNRLVAIVPAAIVPGTVVALQKTHVPDGASGVIVGMLLGLSLVAIVRQRRCNPVGYADLGKAPQGR